MWVVKLSDGMDEFLGRVYLTPEGTYGEANVARIFHNWFVAWAYGWFGAMGWPEKIDK